MKKQTKEITKKKCSMCNGFGLWAIGDPAPMGPIDYQDGSPCKKCPSCGSGRDDFSHSQKDVKKDGNSTLVNHLGAQSQPGKKATLREKGSVLVDNRHSSDDSYGFIPDMNEEHKSKTQTQKLGDVTSDEAMEIYLSFEPRLAHLWEKLTSGNYNGATQHAFTIGALGDIDECLKRLKLRRTVKK